MLLIATLLPAVERVNPHMKQQMNDGRNLGRKIVCVAKEKRDGGPPLPCLSPETEEGDAAYVAAASHSRSPEKKASPEFLLSSSVCVVVHTAEPPLRRFCSSKRERDEEVGCEGITSAWAGGENGRTVINKILLVADELLSERGWLYLLTLAANNPSEICLQMRKKGYASRVIL
nr:hemK methyltransferase family member 2 [Ipomoea batatas]